MASAAAATTQAAATTAATATTNPKLVDESLWWDPFVLLYDDLDRAPLSDELPHVLVNKIKNNRSWFLESLTRFKPPNEVSRRALDSPELILGSQRLVIKPELKETALRASKCLVVNAAFDSFLIQ
ncbi:hypothetical protein ACMD2_22401 [Ananas comosus]|uniref:Uncharacterized protein n=1 Tax=Ananas comosus TaxID=4615 RepID=A0A199UJ21_ANACO|nr:hypothetical protein ACMD2_22401 [Ananas comosus]